MAAVLPTLFVAVVITPVDVLGCVTRGLLALGLAVASVSVGLGAAVQGRSAFRRGDPNARCWMLCALVLAAPGAAMLFLA